MESERLDVKAKNNNENIFERINQDIIFCKRAEKALKELMGGNPDKIIKVLVEIKREIREIKRAKRRKVNKLI